MREEMRRRERKMKEKVGFQKRTQLSSCHTANQSFRNFVDKTAETHNFPSSKAKRRTLRPSSANSAKHDLRNLNPGIAMIQRAPDGEEIRRLLQKPREQRERRRRIRENIELELQRLPRFQRISGQKLRAFLEDFSASEDRIRVDRQNFISALRTSGLTSKSTLLSRIFSCFDKGNKGTIRIDRFIEFFNAHQLKHNDTKRFAPPPSQLVR